MYGILPGTLLAGALGIYLLATGSLPIGRFPGFFRSDSDSSSVFFRIAGGIILAGLILPHDMLSAWYGEVVLLAGSLVVLFIGIVASLSGRAR